MHPFAILLALIISATTLSAPALVRLKQDPPRKHPNLKLPFKHTIGPTLPGLRQGAVPQGLAYWDDKKWFLVSYYFDKKDHPSVIVALDSRGSMVRCLTLTEPDGKAFTGHVGGLAISKEHLWIASDQLFRLPLAMIDKADPYDHIELRDPFTAESTASFVAFYDQRIWVGEFVSPKNDYEAKPTHKLKDRNGVQKYAWIVGYRLDENENLLALDDNPPLPDAILSVRQKVQGMTFLGDNIILSMSYGRKNYSTLSAYKNPLDEPPHTRVELAGRLIPVWHLDGKNKQWDQDDFPPMSEGVTGYNERFALIFESGAEKFQWGGRGAIDTVMICDLPTDPAPASSPSE